MDVRLLLDAAALIGIFNLVWSIYACSLKYDITDAMLAGQNEAADFFCRSLSTVRSVSEELRKGHGLIPASAVPASRGGFPEGCSSESMPPEQTGGADWQSD